MKSAFSASSWGAAAFAAAALLITPASAANVTVRDWGVTEKGVPVQLYTLKGARGLEARVTNFGAVLTDLIVPTKDGRKVDVLLGFDDFKSYERGGVYGALIGRYTGRISKGGSFTLNGKTHQLQKTNPNARFVIHGGTAQFHRKLWHAEMKDGVEPSVMLTMASPDGDGGFPGLLVTTVTYTMTRDNGLRIDYQAASPHTTIANLTNHAYFALQGEGNGDISNQTLQVFADRFTPQDADNLVTGEIAPVDGTPLDFRKPKRLGDVLTLPYPQIAMRRGLDISMIINGKPGSLRPAARLTDPGTGIVMDVLTTQPAIQLYSHNVGANTSVGKGGKTYRAYYALCLETEGYLDAVNQPQFPSSHEVGPGKPMHEVAFFRFGIVK
jgi:aldose 1-epimerase